MLVKTTRTWTPREENQGNAFLFSNRLKGQVLARLGQWETPGSRKHLAVLFSKSSSPNASF